MCEAVGVGRLHAVARAVLILKDLNRMHGLGT